MKELIPANEYGIFADMKETVRVNSLKVAEYFGKQHKHVLRDVEKITEPKSGLSKEFVEKNFTRANYVDATGRKLPCYQMTRDGFTLLVMGYSGAKAMHFKEQYIKQFNKMEKFIRALAETREEFPLLTANIALIHDDPKPYHYSNEANMLNRLAIGMTAKEFRVLHGLKDGESIRPYLTPEQVDTLDTLQKIDTGLMLAMPDFNQRKRQLQWYLDRTQRKITTA